MASPEKRRLPRGWESRKSRSTGMTYFLNIHTKKSQWDRPYEAAAYEKEDDTPPIEVRCSHILVKHSGSRRPASWREDKVTRSKEDAYSAIREFRRRILNRESSFDGLARQYSDCTSAKRDGDLGRFKRGQMQKAFEDVAFSLKVNQISHAVDTDSGIHLILRTA